MPYLDTTHIAAYLAQHLGQTVQNLELQALDTAPIAASRERGDLRVYGYGQPILIRYQIDGVVQRCRDGSAGAVPLHRACASRANI